MRYRATYRSLWRDRDGDGNQDLKLLSRIKALAAEVEMARRGKQAMAAQWQQAAAASPARVHRPAAPGRPLHLSPRLILVGVRDPALPLAVGDPCSLHLDRGQQQQRRTSGDDPHAGDSDPESVAAAAKRCRSQEPGAAEASSPAMLEAGAAAVAVAAEPPPPPGPAAAPRPAAALHYDLKDTGNVVEAALEVMQLCEKLKVSLGWSSMVY